MKFKILIITFLMSIFTFGQDAGNISSMLNSSAQLTAISVTIGGDFITNGSFAASSTERVDQFVTRVYNMARGQMLSAIKNDAALVQFRQKYERYALRNILLKHSDGSSETIDLSKFRLTGDFNDNPYLKNGDVIIFPPLDLERNFIAVSGAVNKEVKFQFVDGDNLQTALFFARGLNKAFTNLTKAEITRITNDGTKTEKIVVSLNSNIPLLRGDRVRVLFSENYRKDFKVLVLGEVQTPGWIPITKAHTTLGQVIKAAGGFKPDASKKFAQLIRKYGESALLRNKAETVAYNDFPMTPEEKSKLLNQKALEYLRMYRSADLRLEDTLLFNIDNSLRMLEYSPNLDFRNLDSVNSFESNFLVQNGDVIVVPRKEEYIYVWGGVKNPGYYTFSPNKTAEDYINEAGGFSEIAYGESDLYLIKGKTRNWVTIDNISKPQTGVEVTTAPDYKIEPGDFIYAKKNQPRGFGFYLGRTSAIIGIIGGVATTILLLLQLKL
jgi:protein involved in polysaccharide export with SLBB domain